MVFEDQRKFRSISAWEHYEVGDLSGNQIMSGLFCHKESLYSILRATEHSWKCLRKGMTANISIVCWIFSREQIDESKARVLAEISGWHSSSSGTKVMPAYTWIIAEDEDHYRIGIKLEEKPVRLNGGWMISKRKYVFSISWKIRQRISLRSINLHGALCYILVWSSAGTG